MNCFAALQWPHVLSVNILTVIVLLLYAPFFSVPNAREDFFHHGFNRHVPPNVIDLRIISFQSPFVKGDLGNFYNIL